MIKRFASGERYDSAAPSKPAPQNKSSAPPSKPPAAQPPSQPPSKEKGKEKPKENGEKPSGGRGGHKEESSSKRGRGKLFLIINRSLKRTYLICIKKYSPNMVCPKFKHDKNSVLNYLIDTFWSLLLTAHLDRVTHHHLLCYISQKVKLTI